MKKAAFFLLGCFLISCSDEEKSPSILTITPSVADFGQQVTIAGSNFSTTLLDNEVSFNGTPATVTSATATELTVTVPVNSTSGKISIKSQGRQVISATDFTVTCGQWFSRAALPQTGESDNAITFTALGYAFVMLGQASVGGALQDAVLYRFDPTNNSWTPKTIYDKEFFASSFASWGSYEKGFVLEPYGGDLHVYDANSDSWSIKSNPYTANSGDKYPIIAFNIGNDGYVMLSDNNVWKYNIAGDSWTNQGVFTGELDFSYEIYGLATSTKGYLGNGSALWEFDPVTKQWTQKASVSAQTFLMFATHDGVYAADCSTEGKGLWEFNVSKNIWTRKASLPGGQRYSPLFFGLGDKGYVGGGNQTSNDQPLKDFFVYMPAGGID
ncbi:IPT/TIG domain-containing protein [Chryseolinea soli]|uniref:IPT/TIG domain-containing protein n=1 Tax=Chryseolinea soli TaxID=2321403 RepID=A0A385SU10_9BACT|nr:IPT/TIG domain-containing protein [Chryseolinea soli]AYB32298.1 hypothetical protein D4L85_17725 [Chryseolinea soli]